MNVVVTGGGTIAPIDDVRSIANASSGRFSAEITEACLRRGATVWHVHAPGAQLPFIRSARFDLAAADPAAEHDRLDALRADWLGAHDRLHLVRLRTGTVADYAETLRRVLTDRPVDVALLAMAVSDYEPEPFAGKIDSDAKAITVRARRAPKVIRAVRDWSPGVFLAGFKLLSRAASEDLIRAAEEACRTNRADVTIANDLQTLREGRHRVYLVRPGAEVETFGPGEGMACALVDRVFALARARRDTTAGSP
jgi:phosphopantothenoylcysteine synthetase/decarboxylase